jgi:hypothetical protein
MKDLLLRILKEPDSIIALSALIVSVISLLLSLISAFHNRKNNRLSVRPLAYILPPDYEEYIAVIIQNKGTGPLITKRIKFIGENNIEKSNLIDFMPKLDDGYYWNTFSKASKIILSTSEEKVLLEFRGDISDKNFIRQRNEIREALSKVEIKIEYTSIFNEMFSFKLNYRLSWFGRQKY